MAQRRHLVLMLGALNSPHLEHLARAMAQRDLTVAVAGYVSPSLPAPDYPHEIGVYRMPARALSRAGLPFHLRWLRQLVARLQPAVIQAHGLAMFGFSAAVCRVRPLVGVAWGSDVLAAGRRLIAQDRYAISRCALVMGDTPMLLRRLAELGASPAQLRLLEWGVDLELFRPPAVKRAVKRDLGLSGGPVVLSPRGLGEVYNPAVILAAFKRIRERLPNAQLLLKHPSTETPAAFRSEGAGVRVVSSVPYGDLVRYYQAADVCVSIPSSDSGPRSVWEAMACGVPCVVSDLPWARESLRLGTNALATPIDEIAVAETVERVLSDSELAERLATNGRLLVESTYDQEAAMDRARDALLEVIEAAQPKPTR